MQMIYALLIFIAGGIFRKDNKDRRCRLRVIRVKRRLDPISAVIFNSHKHTAGSEQSTPHFQVPAVIVSAAENGSTIRFEARFD